MNRLAAKFTTDRPASGERVCAGSVGDPDPARYEQMSRMPFRPGSELIHLLQRHEAEGVAASAAMASGFQEQAQALGRTGQSAEISLEELVTEQVEGLCSSLARFAASRGLEVVRLSKAGRFEPAVREEVLRGLELDQRRAAPLLDRLHHELQQFAAAMPRHRDWGTLLADASGIVLAVDVKQASAVPQINQLPPESWTVLR